MITQARGLRADFARAGWRKIGFEVLAKKLLIVITAIGQSGACIGFVWIANIQGAAEPQTNTDLS